MSAPGIAEILARCDALPEPERLTIGGLYHAAGLWMSIAATVSRPRFDLAWEQADLLAAEAFNLMGLGEPR